MRIYKFTATLLFLFLISTTSSATVPEYAQPINAYQEKYDMSFFVWKPAGLQMKWHATYDGYPVTETAKDRWVYGVLGSAGELTESLIPVGSVNPETVNMLTRLPMFTKENTPYEKNYITASLTGIFNSKCDSFGIARTNASFTPIAWESDTLKIYIWNGKQWTRVKQRIGERLTDAVERDLNIAGKALREHKIRWTQIDTYEFANYVRSAGYTWIGDFEINMPNVFRDTITANGGNERGESYGGSGRPGGEGGWDTGRE